jgi:hypothetical protein
MWHKCLDLVSATTTRRVRLESFSMAFNMVYVCAQVRHPEKTIADPTAGTACTHPSQRRFLSQ